MLGVLTTALSLAVLNRDVKTPITVDAIVLFMGVTDRILPVAALNFVPVQRKPQQVYTVLFGLVLDDVSILNVPVLRR